MQASTRVPSCCKWLSNCGFQFICCSRNMRDSIASILLLLANARCELANLTPELGISIALSCMVTKVIQFVFWTQMYYVIQEGDGASKGRLLSFMRK